MMFIDVLSKFRYQRANKNQGSNSYAYRFYSDLTTGFSFYLCDKKDKDHFIEIEPKETPIERVLHTDKGYYWRNDIEQKISEALKQLLEFGESYIWLSPEFEQITKGEKDIKSLTKLRINTVHGHIKKKTNDEYVMECQGYDGKLYERRIPCKELIILKLKELGYRKNYFSHLLKDIGNYDLSKSMIMFNSKVVEYDFQTHQEKNRFMFLKETKDIGWSFTNDDLSNSSVLYRRIRLDEFRKKELNYVLRKINEALPIITGETNVKFVACLRKLNYVELWKQYQDGRITTSEFNNLIFNNTKCD